MIKVLITLIFIGVFYLASRFIFETLSKKLKTQRIILELIFGVLIGSTPLILTVNDSYLSTVATISAVVLLFSVGVGSKITHLLKEKTNIIILATVGVIVPFVLVYLSCLLFKITGTTALFIAAAAVSTSVSISARILYENHKCNSDVGTIILGASVLDDIYGLVLLSALTAYFYKDSGSLPMVCVGILVFAALIFLSFYAKKIITTRIKKKDTVIAVLSPALISLPFVAGFLNLTPITGAYFSGLLSAGELSDRLSAVLKHTYAVLIPVFFIYTGTRIGLQTLLRPNVLIFGIILFVAVLLGQLIAGLSLAPFVGIYHGLLTGFGMLPRGEVAMYISVTALGLGVITKDNFGSITVMILLCTIAVSTLLKRFIRSACRV